MSLKRKVSGCIPFRKKGGLIEFCIVRTNSGSWGFPKGGVEPDLTPKQNAVKETWEEAGLVGVLTDKLGRFSFMKNGVKQKVVVYALEAVLELKDYPEAKDRQRKWVSIDEVLQVEDLSEDWKFILIPLLAELQQ